MDPYWAVTAASCFADDPATVQTGAPKVKTTVTFGEADLTATTGGHATGIAELAPRADRDLVTARLAQPATGIAPFALGTAAPAQGEDLQYKGDGTGHLTDSVALTQYGSTWAPSDSPPADGDSHSHPHRW